MKKIFFCAVFFPIVSYGQTNFRPNHNLPEYKNIISENKKENSALTSYNKSLSSLVYLNKNSIMNNFYTDGSPATLHQIGQIADGSVQQSDVGITVAGLNDHKQVTDPIVGDVTMATAISMSPFAIRNAFLGDALNDMYLHNMGVRKERNIFNNSDLNSIIFNKNLSPLTIHLSSNEHYPSGMKIPAVNYNKIYVRADGQLLSPDMESSPYTGNPQWNGGHLSSQVGESALVEAYEPKFGIIRDREYNNNDIFNYKEKKKPAGINSDYYTINSKWVDPVECNKKNNDYWCDRQNWSTSMHTNTLNSTSNVGMGITYNTLTSTGFGYGGAFDVEDFEILHTGGTNWHWVSVNESDEIDHMTPGGYLASDGKTVIQSGARNFNNEWDMSGYGPEDPRTSYNPDRSTRIPFLFNTWYPGSDPVWKPKTFHHAFEIIVVPGLNGKKYMYEATKEGGVTGNSQPSWKFDETSSFVKDGTQSWVYVGIKRFEIGRIFGISGAEGTRFGTLMSTDAVYYNSIFDFSRARFDTPKHIFARIPSDSYLDLTGNGTAEGQNNHILGYDSKYKSLTYKVSGINVFSITDSGAIISSAPSRMPVMTRTQIRAYPSPSKGMEIYDSDDDAPAIYTASGWKIMPLSALPKD